MNTVPLRAVGTGVGQVPGRPVHPVNTVPVRAVGTGVGQVTGGPVHPVNTVPLRAVGTGVGQVTGRPVHPVNTVPVRAVGTGVGQVTGGPVHPVNTVPLRAVGNGSWPSHRWTSTPCEHRASQGSGTRDLAKSQVDQHTRTASGQPSFPCTAAHEAQLLTRTVNLRGFEPGPFYLQPH